MIPNWVAILGTLIACAVIYQMGHEAGKRDAWKDAETIGAKVADRIKKEGIKIVEVDGTMNETFKKFAEMEAPRNPRSIN